MKHIANTAELFHDADGFDDMEAGWFVEEDEPILEEADGF